LKFFPFLGMFDFQQAKWICVCFFKIICALLCLGFTQNEKKLGC